MKLNRRLLFGKLFFLMINVLLILILLVSQTVYAKNNMAQDNHVSFSFKELGYTIDDEFQGVSVSRQYDVNIPRNWNIVEPAEISLWISHSPSLNTHSSMVVDWNGTRIGSTMLDKTNLDHGRLVLDIPADLIQSGYNQLTVQFYMGIRDDFCEDFDNPAVWAVVHQTSSFDLTYEIQPAEIDLYGLSDRLIDPSPLIQNDITIVLPENPDIEELDAAALVSAKLGQFADWRPLNLQTATLEDFDDSMQGNLIFVGRAAHLEKLNSDLLPGSKRSGSALLLEDEQGNPIDSDAGVLWLQASPSDDNSIWLSVTAASSDGLRKAAGAFATSSLYNRFTGQLAVVLDVPEANTNIEMTPGLVYTLSDLGYSDIVATGNRQQSTYLTIPVQMVFDSLGDANLLLSFSHSQVLNEKRSSLDVLLNDVPVSSITLNDNNAEDASVSINIPLRLFKLGDNTLTLTSNIQVTDSVAESTLYCTDQYYSDSWLTIHSNSTLTFPTGISQFSSSLTGYPGFYFGDPSLSNLAFVVSDSPDWTTSDAVLEIANRIGRVSRGDALYLGVVNSSGQVSTAETRPYQILVGLPAQNPSIMAINELLPQSFNEQTFAPMPLDGTASLLSSNSLGYIESVFTKTGEYRFIVTATSSEGLNWAAQALNNPDLFQLFEGNLAILSGDEEIAFYSVNSSTSVVTNQFENSPIVETNSKQYPNWVLILAASILVLSLGVAVVTIFIRKS